MSGGKLILEGIGLIIFAIILSIGISVGDFVIGLRGGIGAFLALTVIGIGMIVYGVIQSVRSFAKESTEEQRMLDELMELYLEKYGKTSMQQLHSDISRLNK